MRSTRGAKRVLLRRLAHLAHVSAEAPSSGPGRRCGVICGLLIFLLATVFPTTSSALEGFDPGGEGPRYPDRSDGRATEVPSLEAHRIANGGIHIDGRLAEADWAQAPAATGFTQFEPDRRGEPCEDTVFKVIYDEDAIYFGVACFRHNGEPITSCLSRRDNIRSSDRIRVYISPYHDMVTGYHFRIYPDGVKEDYYNYGDLYHDISWDAVWEADTSVDDQGWYAEIRIPFSSIRYRAAPSMTWGCNIFQYIHSRAQRTAWSNWDRDQHGFMSRSGTITGIDGIRAPRQLEITPYAVSRLTDPADPTASGFSDEEWDHFGNFGADLKYGVTADLTLNATFQPDFGQVEADPSLLNLSPYETYYDEKRPFFIEGAQFFWAPDNVVFYSRRIGTGSENARIRFAGKLTGKITGDISTAVLVAATDETEEGRAHNPFRDGDHKAVYSIGRFGKQFGGGMHSVNIMQTAVIRDRSSFGYPTRNGYVSGADFEFNFKDRMYRVTGSFVGSLVDPLPDPLTPDIDPDPSHGTGTRFELQKTSGKWRFALTTRHQGDQLDLNDLGYISDPDHYAVQGWVTRVFNADDNGQSFLRNASVHLRYYRSWIYAGRDFADPNNPTEALWSYDRGHDLRQSLHLETDIYTRDCWGAWFGGNYNPESTSIYDTRWTPDYGGRGPLMTSPENLDVWAGFHTDSRKDLTMHLAFSGSASSEGSNEFEVGSGISWVQSSRISHNLEAEYETRHDDAQWITNVDNPGGGIGDVSYVFAELDQEELDLTLRSSILFTRDSSLELYFQPYLTMGNYSNPRELSQPDSYDLQSYAGLDPTEHDFSYGAVNVNVVYRWEYRPGSTFYLVWTHGRSSFDRRGNHAQPENFRNDLRTDPLFDNEAENRFLVKVSYWIPV